ncbi:unnamed protein product [Cyprideis torosa]|uniref:Uncharacterized protein n=1 Tax=Cyprideis torosa TaxID=163714 RepID=A0A7R8WMR6_9CRUS|nr:unnamed protein product [Cyprideis torosa]CAG0905525.1 unnamed protein product [Cyprideis torosa]
MSHLLYLFAQSRAMTRLSLVLQDEEGEELELTGPRYNNPLTEAEGEEVAMLARMKGVDFRLITAYRSTLFIRPALYVAIG